MNLFWYDQIMQCSLLSFILKCLFYFYQQNVQIGPGMNPFQVRRQPQGDSSAEITDLFGSPFGKPDSSSCDSEASPSPGSPTSDTTPLLINFDDDVPVQKKPCNPGRISLDDKDFFWSQDHMGLQHTEYHFQRILLLRQTTSLQLDIIFLLTKHNNTHYSICNICSENSL